MIILLDVYIVFDKVQHSVVEKTTRTKVVFLI